MKYCNVSQIRTHSLWAGLRGIYKLRPSLCALTILLKMTPSLIISLLLGASLCRALPGSLQNHRILTSSDNPFDGGAVESCEIPTTELCTGIDYTVPTSIARLAAIIEDEIRSKLSDLGRSNSCRPVVEELMCSMRFPRCQRREGSQEMEVVINHQNCSRVLSVCSAEIAEHVHGMCTGLTQTTVSVGGCRPISNHTLPENFNFEQCSLGETTLVTEWMLEYLKYAEQHTTRSFLYTSSQSVCGQKLASYQCQFLGRCTPDGQRVEFINTHESCNDAVNW